MKVKSFLVTAVLVSVVFFGFACCGGSSGKIATIERMGVTSFSYFTTGYDHAIVVYLKPTSSAKANILYQADLYESGQLRATTTVKWNQPQLNVLQEQAVYFPSSRTEYQAYSGAHISDIFSVKVHE